ncbi:cytochrome c oxidase subunit II [Zeimonas sediminis]|uniref:cytochrome c oxidase subunit II n=1 Tax=Zeimonas sediminis TaxID=2944268 RepID=UPI003AF08800
MKLKRAAGALAAAVLGGWLSVANAVGDMPGGPKVNGLNLQDPVTKIAADQHWIHWFLIWICVGIFIVVFGVMFYSVWAHRKSKGHKPASFHESTAVEVAWTIVPFLIVVAMAIPATRMVVEQKDTSNADITVKVTGYQWKWGYDYLKGEGEGISFLSTLSTPRAQIEGREEKSVTYLMEVDNPMVVPVGQKVRVVLTANDVIHSWMVPAFGVKQDAIPGFVRDTWFRAEKVGVYRGQCAELCGKDHAFMPIVVEVKSKEDYAKWVDEQKKAMLAKMDDPNKEWAQPDLMARGEKVYQANCVACHQANGKGVPPAFPALEGSKLVLGPQAPQVDIVLNGKQGTAMASFKQLSDVEIAAVITYTRNAWGNKAEDGIVQPSEVKAARK